MTTLATKDKYEISAQVSYLLTEAGDYLLQENGDKIIIRFGQWANKGKNISLLTTKDKN